MKILPDKVEGKIFLLVLVISLSLCLLATRLIVLSQESSILAANNSRLTSLADLFVERIDRELSAREAHAVGVNATLTEALAAATEDSVQALQVPPSNDVRITGPRPATWSDSTRISVVTLASVMNDLRSIATADFEHVFIRLIDPGITIEFVDSATDRIRSETPIDAELASPSNNPEQLPVWTTLSVSGTAEGLCARLLVPIHVNGRFVGVSGGDFRLREILAQAGLNEREGFGTLALFDSERKLLGSSEPRWSDNAIQAIAGVRPPGGERSSGSKTLVEMKLREGDIHVYSTKLARLDWTVTSAVTSTALYAQLTLLTWKLYLSALVLALILVLLLRASFRQLFINRVLALEQATRAFAQHGVSNFPNLGNDEIGELTHTFEEMVDSLASREAELTIRNQQLKNEISGRLSAVESLRESERKFRTLFEKSSDAVLVFDGERYIDCNEAAMEMLGFTAKAQLLSADPASFHPPVQPDGLGSVEKESAMIEVAKRKGEHRYEWVCQTVDGRAFWVEVVLTLIPYGGRDVLYMVWRDISDRKREEEERVRLTTALEQAAESIIVTDTEGYIVYVNPSFERLTKYSRDEAVGKHNDLIHAGERDAAVLDEMRDTIRAGRVWKGRIANSRKDGTLYQAETTISPVRDAIGGIINFVIVSYDVTKEASLEAQLIQAQKMEAIGELASGIAHEINTPTQYIGDNIRFFQQSFNGILTMLNKCEALVQTISSKEPADDQAEAIERLIEEIDLQYLKEEIPIAIEQSIEGNARVAEIVRAMKEFAHPGIEDKKAIDVNHAIRNTIAVARNEWKYVADIELDLDEHLPEVPCLPGSFNQVILNIIVNASHAIGDAVGDGAKGKGKISVSTGVVDGWAELRISDTGTGIPENIRSKIFDPFFTTKGVGKGTGQGLALVHTVIVEKHAGTIEVDSTVGVGTTFTIRLPLADAGVTTEDAELAAATPGH